jgi:preprotein translocase subunit SecY
VAENKQNALSGSGKFGELKSRLLFVLGALLVYRIGTFIPVPGIDPAALAVMFDQQKGTILDMFNMFSGGALYFCIDYYAVIKRCSSKACPDEERGRRR